MTRACEMELSVARQRRWRDAWWDAKPWPSGDEDDESRDRQVDVRRVFWTTWVWLAAERPGCGRRQRWATAARVARLLVLREIGSRVADCALAQGVSERTVRSDDVLLEAARSLIGRMFADARENPAALSSWDRTLLEVLRDPPAVPGDALVDLGHIVVLRAAARRRGLPVSDPRSADCGHASRSAA